MSDVVASVDRASEEAALQIALTILGGQRQINDDHVERAIQAAMTAAKVMRPGAVIDATRLRRRIEELVTVWVADQVSLADDRDHHPWLAAERAEIDWQFWERYERYLQSLGWAPAAVSKLGDVTDDVLGRLESPRRSGAWDRRGMVVGQVQAGKTSNYIGLICKAADAGYRLIVILAGLHDSLRSQTQRRVDEGFLGFDSRSTLQFNDSERNRRIGSGALLHNAKLLPTFTFTSSLPKGDFNRGVASRIAGHVGSDPVVLVVKKNKTILENLISWASTAAVEDPSTGRRIVLDQPLLVIDDEADNASVNTREIEREVDEDGQLLSETDPATINRLIRKLLHTYEETAYVGYTATPFANIFIWQDAPHGEYGDDLFPRSFIVRMPPPSNYVGPAQVFGVRSATAPPDAVESTGLPIIRHVDDFGAFVPDKHRKDLVIGPLPPSLREAMRAFVLACAGRAARGQTDTHNSMLVHVTRFVDVQRQVAEAVRDELENIRLRLKNGDGDRRRSIRDELRELWERDFVPTSRRMATAGDAETEWRYVDARLWEATARITVVELNGSARDALTYTDEPQGVSVIAVGGDKLSRGLTLEGLSVSYYLRATRMYDTLMQMGRWFGFRSGYLDLCRLYTTAELADWYGDITAANEELLAEFDEMAAVGGTPADYGLRVLKHPDGLMITARAKMRSGREFDLSFSKTIIETTAFNRDPYEQERNEHLVGTALETWSEQGYRWSERPRGAHIWRWVPGADVATLLDGFIVSGRARRANGRLLARYIRACLAQDELTDWTVALISIRDREADGPPFGGVRVGPVVREQRLNPDGTPAVLDHYSIRRLVSPSDEWLDLAKAEIDAARQIAINRFRLGNSRAEKEPKEPDGLAVREVRSPHRGLLLLYPLDQSKSGISVDGPVIGFAVSFPQSPTARTIKYQVTPVFWQTELGFE